MATAADAAYTEPMTSGTGDVKMARHEDTRLAQDEPPAEPV
jgi:hypothetical protein